MATKPPVYRQPGGMFAAIRDDPLGMNERMLAKGEPVLRARFGPMWQWAVFDAELAWKILSAEMDDYPRPGIVNAGFKAVSGTNVFTTTGSPWAWRRRAMQPSFGRAPIEGLAEALGHFIDDEIQAVPPGRLPDAQAWFASITISVAASALFGQRPAPDERARLDTAFQGIARWVGAQVRSRLPLPPIFPTAQNRELRRCLAVVRSWLQQTIDQRRRDGVGSSGDVLDTLLTMTDPSTTAPLPDERVIDEAMVLLFAGYETTAAAATWTMTYLADRPDLQARLAAAEPGLVERVVSETLRLRPPVWGAARMAKRTGDLGGYRIRRFTPVVVPVYAIHRNPTYWPEPDRFDPDRFLPEQAKGRPGSAFLPFIVGPRHCLGMRLALLELHLLIEAFCRCFEVATVGPIEPDATLALRVRDGLPLQLVPRMAA